MPFFKHEQLCFCNYFINCFFHELHINGTLTKFTDIFKALINTSITYKRNTNAHICIHTYVCMYVVQYIRSYVCMYVRTYVYICMYVCTYVRTGIYTCIHVCVFSILNVFKNSVRLVSQIWYIYIYGI